MHFARNSKYKKQNFSLNKNRSNAQLDYEKILFPLTFRNYKEGEKFIPLGMSKNKKVSSIIHIPGFTWEEGSKKSETHTAIEYWLDEG